MSSTTSRRRLLAAGAALGLTGSSGCLDALRSGIGTASDTEAAAHRLRLTLSDETASLRDRYVYDLAQSPPKIDDEAFAAAVAGETYTTRRRKPFFAREEPKYAERDGTYYRLGSVVVGERKATHPVLRLTEVGRTSELDSVPDHADRGDLPEVDRRAVRIAYMAARARGNAGGVPWGLVRRGGYVYPDADAVGASRLLGDGAPSHVKYRDRIYEVRVSRETFYEPVYRAEVDRVAESPAEMEAVLRARFVEARFGGSELSSEERSILRDARASGGYEESHPYSEAYRSLLKRLHRRAYLDGNIEKDAFAEKAGTTYLRYDGQYYEYRLRFVGSEN